MKSYLFSILIVGVALGNVDILIPESGQVPVVGWTHTSTPLLMYCEEPAQPVVAGCTSPCISISLHEGSDSDPVLLAVSGEQDFWNFSATFMVFDLPGLSVTANRQLASDEIDPPVYCSWFSLPILPRYADCQENRRMFLVMNTGYTDSYVQDETWMTTVSIDPWSSSVVNTADTTHWRQGFFTSWCLLSGQIPQGTLPAFTMASGSWDGYPGPSYYGINSIYLESGTLRENALYAIIGNPPGTYWGVIASGYSQTGQICLWAGDEGEVWCSSFTTSVTEPESSPMVIDHDELPFAAAMTRTRDDNGLLLAWYDGSNIMVRHWQDEWNGYAHVVEPWINVSPGNIAVCSDTDGYWVAWKDDTSAIPEYRFIARNTVTGIEEAETPVDNPLRISIGQNPITAVTSYSIDLPVQERYTLTLYDICGRDLGEITSGEGKEVDGVLDLSAYPAGIYTLVLGTEQGTSTVRVLKTGN